MNIDPLLECVTVGLFQVNCYILACPQTREAVIVDPGGETPRILAAVRSLGVRPTMIVNTHGHMDHTAGNADVAEAFAIPVAIHRDDLFLLHGEDLLGLAPLLQARPSPEPTLFLDEETPLVVGGLRLRVLHTPGHSPGSCCLLLGDPSSLDSQAAGSPASCRLRRDGSEGVAGGMPALPGLFANSSLFSGDTLVAGGVGRTDLPGGDPRALMDSLGRKILTLPLETRVLPGHGPETVLSDELQENP